MEIDKIIDNDITKNRDDEKLWYAITTFSGHERKVLDDIVRKLVTERQHGDIVEACFVPEKEVSETVVDKKGNKKVKTKMKNMTPGYIYIKMKMTDDAWFTIRNTPSVSGFVGSHGKRSKPIPISEQEMLPVLKYCDRMDLVKTLETPYKKGDMVKILRGPFADKHGTVESYLKDKGAVKINVIMLGQTIDVEVDIDNVGKYQKS